MRLSSSLAFSIVIVCLTATAQESRAKVARLQLGKSKLALTAPATWTKKEPANRIVEVEYAIPPAKGDETPGRLTAMGASGTVEANIQPLGRAVCWPRRRGG